MAIPDTAYAGDTGHIADHNLIADTLSDRTDTNVFDVAGYGAVGDGATNDAAAITNAIAAAEAAGGGTVIFGVGTYLINSNIAVPHGVNIVGQGNGVNVVAGELSLLPATLIKCGDATAGLSFGTRTTASRGGLSKGFVIDGANTATNPLYVGMCVSRTFLDVEVLRSAGTGMLLEAGQNNLFLNCNFAYAATGVVLDYGAGGNLFSRCEFDYNTSYALRLQQSGASPSGVYTFGPTHNTFDHCIFERTSGGVYAVRVDKATHLTFNSCAFSSEGDTAAEVLLYVAGGGVVRAAGGFFQSNTAAACVGVEVAGGSTVILDGYPTLTNLAEGLKVTSGTIQVDGGVRLSSVSAYASGAGNNDNYTRSRHRSPVEITRGTTSEKALIAKVDGEVGDRFWVDAAGIQRWGDGSGFTADVNLYRIAAGRLYSGNQIHGNDGLTTKVKAGIPGDADFTVTPQSGTLAVDTTNSRLYVRVGSTWKYVTLT